MTRKHFEAAAAIVKRAALDDGQDARELVSRAQDIAARFIELFEQFSPNFDRARFLKACGL